MNSNISNPVKLNCKIGDIAYYLPKRIVDNAELSLRYEGWDEEKIFEKTGIRCRHVVDDEYVSDLAVKAAQKLFEKGAVSPQEIEILALCTQTPDYAFPATAYLVQERLSLPERCLVFDFNQGCTGFISGLSIVGSMLHAGFARKALLITSETYSRWCHPMDKGVTTIFGDGAAAVYLRMGFHEGGIGPFWFGTDGKGFKHLTVPVSGAHQFPYATQAYKEQKDNSGNVRTALNLYMNGPELFRFAINTVPSMVRNILSMAKKEMNDIDKFIFHQANAYILRNIQRKLAIPDKKMIYDLKDIGNTVSASIPIAIERAYERKEISPGERLLLVGFGVGYAWSGTMLTWEPDIV